MLASQPSAAQEKGLPAAAAFDGIRRKFTNQRRWREFVSAVQVSVKYPAAMHALRHHTQWFQLARMRGARGP
jgi:hypothetical protein